MSLENIGLVIALVFSVLTIYFLHEDYSNNRLSKKKFITIFLMEGFTAIGAIILMLIS